MKLKITIDIFSGRPNPTAILEGKNAKAVLDQMSLKSVFKKTAAKQTPEPFNLGYRGIIVEQVDKASTAHPMSMKVTPDRVYAAARSASAADNFFEKIAFNQLSKFKGIGNKKEFQRLLETSVTKFRTHRLNIKGSLPVQGISPLLVRACGCAPEPDIAWWNDGGERQFNNNCYNYASNYRSDTFAQPGNAAGQQYTTLSDCNVRAGQRSAKSGAIADKLIDNPTANNKCPATGHLVALVIDPGNDFHWYRKGKNGLWSHKPGSSPATTFDNSGNTITDPRTADRGGYTHFCTFMTVIHGHIKIK
jgi:hypothetical protein